jgi:hypothetical protein
MRNQFTIGRGLLAFVHLYFFDLLETMDFIQRFIYRNILPKLLFDAQNTAIPKINNNHCPER